MSITDKRAASENREGSAKRLLKHHLEKASGKELTPGDETEIDGIVEDILVAAMYRAEAYADERIDWNRPPNPDPRGESACIEGLVAYSKRLEAQRRELAKSLHYAVNQVPELLDVPGIASALAKAPEYDPDKWGEDDHSSRGYVHD